ncbi:hypothetical protein FJQ98_15140 [Lysinibacillus agricola]|uniref:Calcineurin-like phosphoesterase domain-containing protein n=1 Tax=Lysinibacillus agricola TaxID=2590012 RepID=A0ABX7AMA1_9BACI|nr:MULTISPECIES: hypothetical protein [Lysinibacillus]QQP10597.1 hypothetical protein FJQ98_15140 [Lysinibacillus agricola]
MKQQVNILHISDIHFGMETDKDARGLASRENALNQLLKTLEDLNSSYAMHTGSFLLGE